MRRRRGEQPPPAVIPSRKMAEWQRAAKVETRLLSRIERMLLIEGDGEEPRRQDVLHVSELTYDSFCPRAAYYRLDGVPLLAEQTVAMRLQAIFEEGHTAHAKWQQWTRRLGDLYGEWLCLICGSRWLGTSPDRCPNDLLVNFGTGPVAPGEAIITGIEGKCWGTAESIAYKEVPILAGLDEFGVIGSADGQLTDASGPVIEAKTIGAGTVRIEAPKLLSKYTRHVIAVEKLEEYLVWWGAQPHSGKNAAFPDQNIPSGLRTSYVDHDGLWRDIRRPFTSHLKQGNIYGYLAGVDEVIFIYEYKPTQAYKEFTVKVSEAVYGPPLEMAKDVHWALERQRAPKCPHGGCKECKAYEGESSAATRSTTTGRGRTVTRPGSGARTPARGDDAETPRRSDRVVRRRPDGAARQVHRVG